MVAEEKRLHRCSDMEDRVKRTVLFRYTLHGISLAALINRKIERQRMNDNLDFVENIHN